MLVGELVPCRVVSTEVRSTDCGELFPPWWVNAESSVGQFGWIALLLSRCAPLLQLLCLISYISYISYHYIILYYELSCSCLLYAPLLQMICFILDIQPIKTIQTNTGPATLWASIRHLKRTPTWWYWNWSWKHRTCVSVRGGIALAATTATGMVGSWQSIIAAHCQATLHSSTSDSKQP